MKISLEEKLIQSYMKFAQKRGKKGISAIHLGASLGVFMYSVMNSIPPDVRGTVHESFVAQQQLLNFQKNGGKTS